MSETALSTLAVYSARPTLQVDGEEHELVHHLLTSLEMTEAEGGMSALELRLDNVVSRPSGGAELAWDDGRVFHLGASLTVLAGDEENPREIFRGTVTALEGHFPADGAPELVVLAEDALQRARLARRTAVYTDATVAQLARRIAQQLSLTPTIDGLDADIGTQVQVNESDLAFLRRVLAAHDADLQVIGSELHVAPRGDVRRGTLELHLHSQLRSAHVLADLSHQVSEVTTAGWDPARGRAVSGRGRGAQLGPGSGSSGAQVLGDTLSRRAEHVRDLAVTTDEEAAALADAAFDRRARRFVVVEGTSEGNPLLRVGTEVTLRGLSERWDNTYHVVRATHRFDRDAGYSTEFEAECAFLEVA